MSRAAPLEDGVCAAASKLAVNAAHPSTAIDAKVGNLKDFTEGSMFASPRQWGRDHGGARVVEFLAERSQGWAVELLFAGVLQKQSKRVPDGISAAMIRAQ
jgi:hypothetical protein